MKIKLFCRGSKKLAIKYCYYLKYNLMIALCIIAPVILVMLDYFNVIRAARLKASSFLLVVLFILWLIVLLIGCKGNNSVTALRYQIFAITEDDKLVHFWFKEMLRDGKVVLRFRPYRKKEKQNEFVKIIKSKEDVIKDEKFEDYLRTLYEDEEVQRKSDILFEEMQNIKVVKKRRNFFVVSYTIGKLNTKKKLKIYRNITNLDAMLDVINRH
ncbi:hypothetical protein lbkm_3992 [Lachnospiraceae bacterium KM106-2]|nr:hypothetical protein lbkm_3992 [Lachnospiraceae bacterium KM106-2]